MKVPPPETGLPTAELDTETYTVTVPAGAEVPGCEEPPAEELELEEPDELEEALEEEELDPKPALEDEEDPEPESEDPLESELSDEDPSPFDFDSSLPEASLDAFFLVFGFFIGRIGFVRIFALASLRLVGTVGR